MKSLCLLFGLVAAVVSADPFTLINTLPTRPVFTVEAHGLTQTRTLAPGNRLRLEAGLFSGLGDKKVPLVAGSIYYFARFGSSPSLYQLAAGQVLVVNQSGRTLSIELQGEASASGLLANEAIALGSLSAAEPEKGVGVVWADGDQSRSERVQAGVYRLVLDSPGIGTMVSLIPWD